MTQARSLRAWSVADRGRLASAARAAFAGFAKAWDIEGDVTCSCTPVTSALDAARWCPLAATGLWCESAPEPLIRALCTALFGATPEDGPAAGGQDGIASVVARKAWTDWCSRLDAAFDGAGLATSGSAREMLRPWSGALAVSLSWFGTPMTILVPGERAAHFLRRGIAASRMQKAGPVTPVWRALSDRPARVRALLQTFELDLGTLASLRVGDVIRTRHELESPLCVTLQGNEAAPETPICGAFLGMSRGSRAVALSSAGLPALDRNPADRAAPQTDHSTTTNARP
jgi:hypothetical protein